METLEGLDNVTSAHSLTVAGNSLLTNLTGLNSLNNVKYLEIFWNSVSDLSALSNLEEVRQLYLGSEPMTDLSVLNDTKITQQLILIGLQNLETLEGFDSISTIGVVENDTVFLPGQVQVIGLPNLKRITAFPNLDTSLFHWYSPTSPWATIDIYDNPQLVEITGFTKLHYTGGGLTLQNNPSLADVSGFCTLFRVGYIGPGSVVSGNPLGFNTLGQIVAGCDTVVLDGKELLQGEGMSVFPNPADREALVDITTGGYALLEGCTLELYSATGTVCGKWQLHAYSPLLRVETGHLPAGLYRLVLRENGRIAASKTLVVQH